MALPCRDPEPHRPGKPVRIVCMESLPGLIGVVLMGALAPLWLLAGVADYVCHRVQHIERSSGVRESMLHLLMLGQLGVGLLTALFLEFTAAAFAVMLTACMAHEATTWADLAYAEPRRRIPWYEQVVHALQQAIPWVGLLLLMLAHATQALALFAIGPEPPDWSLRLKAHPLPTLYVAVFLGASLLCVVAPFAEELQRCRRAPADRRV